MPLDLSFPGDVIDDLATGSTYTVIRRQPGQFVAGVAKPGLSTELQIEAVEVPAGPRDLLRLPEGRRTTETRIFFTTTRLLVGGEGAKTQADLMRLEDGRTWEVQQVENWPGYFRCFVQVSAEPS